MAVTLQNTTAPGYAATTASVSPAALPTHQADDILLVTAWIRTTTGSLSTPAGWNVVNSGGTTRGTTSRYYWFWKRATGSSETNPVIAVSGGASADKYAHASCIRGCRTLSNPYEAFEPTTGTADPGVATGVTSLTNNAYIITAGGNEDNVDTQVVITATNAPTDLGTATSTGNRYRTDNGGADGACFISPGVEKPTAGATGSISHDWNGASRPGWGICAFAFVPAISPPTVSLNTADATDFGADTTPTLEFTGTSGDGYDVRYNIQVSTVNTFDIDIYAESNQDTSILLGGGNRKIGQSITGDGNTIRSAGFYLKETSSTGNVTASIYAHSGTFGTSSVGTGSVLATSEIVEASTIGASYRWVQFDFTGGNQIVLSNGTKYVVVVEYTTVGTAIDVGVDSTSPTHAGNIVFHDGGSTWTPDATYDCIFYVNTAVLSKISGTDTGFLNTVTGGDTDPFNSGEKASYTAQSALADGTYYWRARGIDPTGSNLYGAWASTRTFIINTSGGSPPVKRASLLLMGVG